jgi:hypothetical protein
MFRADTGVTLSSGLVSSWASDGAMTLDQGTAANRPSVTAHGQFARITCERANKPGNQPELLTSTGAPTLTDTALTMEGVVSLQSYPQDDGTGTPNSHQLIAQAGGLKLLVTGTVVDTRIVVSGGSGTFTTGETVTESVSSATGTFAFMETIGATVYMHLLRATGTFTGGQTLTGGTSGATRTGGTYVAQTKSAGLLKVVRGSGTSTITSAIVLPVSDSYVAVSCGTTETIFCVNGQTETVAAVAGSGATSSDVFVGSTNTGGHKSNIHLYWLDFTASAKTAAALTARALQMMGQYQISTSPALQVVVDGDSISEGVAATDLQSIVDRLSAPGMPLRAARWYHFGKFGATVTGTNSINARRPARQAVMGAASPRSIGLYIVGTNDISASPGSYATYFANLMTEIVSDKTADPRLKAVVMTVPPRAQLSTNSSYGANRSLYNALLRTSGHTIITMTEHDDFAGTDEAGNRDRVSREGYATTPAGIQGLYRGTWSGSSVGYVLGDRVYFYPPPSWTSTTAYVGGQVVVDTANSRIYRCIADHVAVTRPSAGDPNWTLLDVTTYWQCVDPHTSTGSNGPSDTNGFVLWQPSNADGVHPRDIGFALLARVTGSRLAEAAGVARGYRNRNYRGRVLP